MKRYSMIVTAVTGAVGVFVTSGASATIIDFDNLADETVISNQYPEATFSSSAGNVNLAILHGSNHTPPSILCTGPAGGSQTCVEDTYIDFTVAVTDLTFWAIQANAPGVTAQFNVFENDTFAATVDLVSSGGNPNDEFVDLSSFSNVTRLEIVNILRDDAAESGIGWDTFTFTPIPEPATLSLLVLGGLLAIRHRH